MDVFLDRAADLIRGAEAVVIAAGAGMGVDSGLPDFRGRDGFWRAYPPLEKLGLDFSAIANPSWFRNDPQLAWGFYGHRLNLYRATRPHVGYEILRTWAGTMPRGAFVFTSNVDGQFARAGFASDRIEEVHGSIHALQCLRDCGVGVYQDGQLQVRVDAETMRAVGDLPRCPICGSIARPNILMFGDGGWDSTVAHQQRGRFEDWLGSIRKAKLAIVECGAGTAISTVRRRSEGLLSTHDATLIRINVRDPRRTSRSDWPRDGCQRRIIRDRLPAHDETLIRTDLSWITAVGGREISSAAMMIVEPPRSGRGKTIMNGSASNNDYRPYRGLPPLAGVATIADAARPGLGIEACVTRLKRLHYAFLRLHGIFTARITAEPIYGAEDRVFPSRLPLRRAR